MEPFEEGLLRDVQAFGGVAGGDQAAVVETGDVVKVLGSGLGRAAEGDIVGLGHGNALGLTLAAPAAADFVEGAENLKDEVADVVSAAGVEKGRVQHDHVAVQVLGDGTPAVCDFIVVAAEPAQLGDKEDIPRMKLFEQATESRGVGTGGAHPVGIDHAVRYTGLEESVMLGAAPVLPGQQAGIAIEAGFL